MEQMIASISGGSSTRDRTPTCTRPGDEALIPVFDPAKGDITILQWVKLVDDVARRYGWDGLAVSRLIATRLQGHARKWTGRGIPGGVSGRHGDRGNNGPWGSPHRALGTAHGSGRTLRVHEFAGRYAAARAGNKDHSAPSTSRGARPPAPRTAGKDGAGNSDRPAPRSGRCYLCGGVGHLARQCRKNPQKDGPSKKSGSGKSFMAAKGLRFCWPDERPWPASTHSIAIRGHKLHEASTNEVGHRARRSPGSSPSDDLHPHPVSSPVTKFGANTSTSDIRQGYSERAHGLGSDCNLSNPGSTEPAANDREDRRPTRSTSAFPVKRAVAVEENRDDILLKKISTIMQVQLAVFRVEILPAGPFASTAEPAKPEADAQKKWRMDIEELPHSGSQDAWSQDLGCRVPADVLGAVIQARQEGNIHDPSEKLVVQRASRDEVYTSPFYMGAFTDLCPDSLLPGLGLGLFDNLPPPPLAHASLQCPLAGPAVQHCYLARPPVLCRTGKESRGKNAGLIESYSYKLTFSNRIIEIGHTYCHY
ncbi:hypothetical protein WH47_08403 [Habropoda laboriosa]|uniref:CCHC-type domain-containing protein n=1 Tax=Habropoda laboriosa TaxID=597456 RepID=A0A0L7RGM2_9HYME|nr:hypothetical protein WH47_08403 [Habropoda laboriosa]